jgi:hypothetical protein
LGKSERLKIFPWAPDRNEALLLVVTGKEIPAPDSFSTEMRWPVEERLRQENDRTFMEEFFAGDDTPVFKELEKLWLKKP